jgi:hypothetical protein
VSSIKVISKEIGGRDTIFSEDYYSNEKPSTKVNSHEIGGKDHLFAAENSPIKHSNGSIKVNFKHTSSNMEHIFKAESPKSPKSPSQK